MMEEEFRWDDKYSIKSFINTIKTISMHQKQYNSFLHPKWYYTEYQRKETLSKNIKKDPNKYRVVSGYKNCLCLGNDDPGFKHNAHTVINESISDFKKIRRY